jgi:integrase
MAQYATSGERAREAAVRSLRKARERHALVAAAGRQNAAVPKRSYGSGSLYARADMRGRETWYAKVRVDGRQVKKAIGPKREPGDRDGLTRRQAEARLRKLLDELAAAPRVVERMTLELAGQRYLTHLAALGRRRSTLMDYESYLRVHLAPWFDRIPLEKLDRQHVEAFIADELAQGRSPKSVRNYVGLLHSIFDHAERQGWRTRNPCKLVELPQAGGGDLDIRFLDNTELEALLRAVPLAGLGPLDRLLYLTAAMTGLRQGELLALRWRDVDWAAGRIRVRQSYVRGEFGRPKSKRSSRSVPLADRLARELERYFQSSAWQADDDLVFGHPGTGTPLERSRLLKRFKGNLARACVREVRFHDLRHTFGTRMAAAGTPLRTLQEWMGHRDFKTTLIYADYQPSEHEAEFVARAFGDAALSAVRSDRRRLGNDGLRGTNRGTNLSETQPT